MALRELAFQVSVLIALASLVGCQTAAGPRISEVAARQKFPRAIVEPKQIEEAIAEEIAITSKAGTLPNPGEPWFEFRPGTSAVLFTAPHATQPMRDGSLRFADSGTGSLAILLNELACAPVLYTKMASPSDPNREDKNDFKKALSTHLKELRPAMLIDLHGSDPSRPYDIDFGTIAGTSLLDRMDLFEDLVQALQAEGISVFSSARFDATGKTVTRWASTQGTSAIQLEISSNWLSHALSESDCRISSDASGLLKQRFARILQALVRFAAAVDQREGRPACKPSPLSALNVPKPVQNQCHPAVEAQ